MGEIIERMLRAARLDPGLVDELETDPDSLRQALIAAGISALAGAIGAAIMSQFVVLPLMIVSLAVGWLLYAALVWVLGTRLLAEPATHAEFADVVRALGFAMAPGVLHVFGFLPFIGRLISPVANLWSLAASVVLMRRVLSYSGWGRTVGVLILAAVVAYGLVFGGVMLTPARSIFAASRGG